MVIEIESVGEPRIETEAEAFTDEAGYFVANQDTLLKNLTYRAKLEIRALGYFDNINALNFELSPKNSFLKENLEAKMVERNVTGEVHGRVINQRSQEAIANALLVISVGSSLTSEREHIEVRTDEKGNFKAAVRDLRFGQDYVGDAVSSALGFAPSETGFNFKLKRRNRYNTTGHVIALLERNTTGKVKTKVLDGRTGKPISFA